jgi:hypothetical protein
MNNNDLVKTQMKKLFSSISEQMRFKVKALMRGYLTEIGHNRPWDQFFTDLIIKQKYNLNDIEGVKYEDEDLVFRTCEPHSVKSVPTTLIKVVNHIKNPHALFHTERVHLMQYALNQYYGVKNMDELKKRKVSIGMISPASGLYLKIFYEQDVIINQAVTNDPNDQERFNHLVLNLLKVAEDPVRTHEIIKRVCTCYQDEKVCTHLRTNCAGRIILLPHSIYYLKDELINDILKQGMDIIFTAHILENNQAGSHKLLLRNKIINTNKGTINYLKDTYEKYYKKKDKGYEYDPNPSYAYTSASWSCSENWVTFNVTDDKIYNHRNYMPALINTKNITTTKTITKVNKYFIHERMIHVAATITGVMGEDNDYNSYHEQYQKDAYLIRPGTQIDRINTSNVGNLYVHTDEKGKTAIMRVHKTNVSFMTFRADQFSLWKKLGWKIGNLFSEKEYMDLTKRYKLEKGGNTIILSNEAFNGLLGALLNTEKLDSRMLTNMWKMCLATFSSTAVGYEQIYDIMTLLIYEGLKTKVAINELSNSETVRVFNQLLQPQKYTWYTKLYDRIFPAQEPTIIKKEVGEIQVNKKGHEIKKQQTYKKKEVTVTRKVYDLIMKRIMTDKINQSIINETMDDLDRVRYIRKHVPVKYSIINKQPKRNKSLEKTINKPKFRLKSPDQPRVNRERMQRQVRQRAIHIQDLHDELQNLLQNEF